MSTLRALLNLDQSPEELAGVYEQDYYWYLKHLEFRIKLLKPLGDWLAAHLCPCPTVVDAGCGEGWLADYVKQPYFGFDGSVVAIARARREHPGQSFLQARIEDPPVVTASVGAVVLGNLLAVLVKPEHRLDFAMYYSGWYQPRYLVVYDLQTLDLKEFDRVWRAVWELEATAEVPGLQEVKKHRRIKVYQCC